MQHRQQQPIMNYLAASHEVSELFEQLKLFSMELGVFTFGALFLDIFLDNGGGPQRLDNLRGELSYSP